MRDRELNTCSKCNSRHEGNGNVCGICQDKIIGELKTIIHNALVSLAIINMPCAEDNLANIATNEDLLKTMADSFREALKE